MTDGRDIYRCLCEECKFWFVQHFWVNHSRKPFAELSRPVPDVIANADWVVELGPGAGVAGGRVLFEGTPAALLTAADSVTARYLAQYLSNGNVTAPISSLTVRGD